MKDNSLMEVRGGIKPKSCLTNACTRTPTNLAPGDAGVNAHFQTVILAFRDHAQANIRRACRVKRMTCRLESDRGSLAVRPRSLREVSRAT